MDLDQIPLACGRLSHSPAGPVQPDGLCLAGADEACDGPVHRCFESGDALPRPARDPKVGPGQSGRGQRRDRASEECGHPDRFGRRGRVADSVFEARLWQTATRDEVFLRAWAVARDDPCRFPHASRVGETPDQTYLQPLRPIPLEQLGAVDRLELARPAT